jgi:hypothetical protein
MRNRSDERYKAVHLACRLRGKKNSNWIIFISAKSSAFRSLSITSFFPSLLLFQVNMTSFTKKHTNSWVRDLLQSWLISVTWYCEASIPTRPCEWPEVVVCDSIVYPKLGTQANPTVIGDNLAPLGSASNPNLAPNIVIQGFLTPCVLSWQNTEGSSVELPQPR